MVLAIDPLNVFPATTPPEVLNVSAAIVEPDAPTTLRLATGVVDVTTNGAVPDATVDVI